MHYKHLFIFVFVFIGFDYLGLSQEDSEENVRTGMEAKGYQVSEEEKKNRLA